MCCSLAPLAVLAFLFGALSPNQAVAGMALPMYTTSLLCELRLRVHKWEGHASRGSAQPPYPTTPVGRPPCRSLQSNASSTAPSDLRRLLRLPDHLGQHPVSACWVGSHAPCFMLSRHARLEGPQAGLPACPFAASQPLLDLVLCACLPALCMGRPHGQPGEPGRRVLRSGWEGACHGWLPPI